MAMAYPKLYNVLSFYLATIIAISQFLISILPYLNPITLLITLADALLSLYLRSCGLCPCTVELDDQTTMNFWVANSRRSNKPALVMLHGYGGNSKWQFIHQVGSLSQSFYLYIPDLLFFGKSYTNRLERTEVFQAKCVAEGLKRLGVERFAVYSISYGGYVAYWLAEMYPELVEKVVVVSCGVGMTEEQKREQINKVGSNALNLLVPESAHDLRLLVNLTMHKPGPSKWVPDIFLHGFINVTYKQHRKEKLELAEHLLRKKADIDLPILTQETLIIWGDKDDVFPVYLAYQLQRQLGPKSKVEIIKDTGHAVNMESPISLNATAVRWSSFCKQACLES
ncbi:PREDICTED: lipase 1-like isoform X1 [Prunus mume]|uniref:Lipase 1-like isoform X1 n=1 Tax=Prunus mume TaxID=102107 RepID=A0ABM1LPN3_PRUMU|nr:PREDICTED: lipase 1-like isoform X1 [Prunus mume]